MTVSSRSRKSLVVGTSVVTVAGLIVLVTGGSAQSPRVYAAAQQQGFVTVCIQRGGPHESKGDLNVRLKAFCAGGQKPLKLALFPGTRGPEGRPGPPGTAANAEYGVARVFVSRGGRRTGRATYSVPLGSPAGSSTGGSFRFSCSPAQAPCKVSLGAAVIADRTGKATVVPRVLIHKEDGPGAPITFCESAEGGLSRIARVPTLRAATRALRTRLTIDVGGTLDCGAGQALSPRVKDIWVPGASNGASTAFYDVAVTLLFK
jgi:hypothetical protein